MKAKQDSSFKTCPLCAGRAEILKKMSSKFLTKKLNEHFDILIQKDLNIIDYEMAKCHICSLEFASPLVEGSSQFYNLITAQPSYYTGNRWEYNEVLGEINSKDESISLLDVGCGECHFFDKISEKKLINFTLTGLDPTARSAEEGIKKGYNVLCMTVEELKIYYPKASFDVITLFHVLEHVSNPKIFIENLLPLLKPTGTLFLSTPYSPMDFEVEWFDALNHPPHHLSRWNAKAYSVLANELELELNIFMPKANHFVRAAMQSFNFVLYGPGKIIGVKEQFATIMKHPLKFFKHIVSQYSRETVNGQTASNEILVKLTK
jgi:2-polyprenyl-3-methyl-5-hydroxy-6-metoxy-1,4-benzoquinol methylase